jgi:hypothetical protein
MGRWAVSIGPPYTTYHLPPTLAIVDNEVEEIRLTMRRTGFIDFSMLAGLAVLPLAMALSFSISAIAQDAKPAPPPPPADLPGHVNYLAQQLYGVMLEDATPITDQIQKLVLAQIEQWMMDRTPTDVEVRRDVDMAFSELHYPLSGQAAAFARPWKNHVVIGAGYTLGWTNIDRTSALAIFSNQQGHSHLVTVTSFVPRYDLHYAFPQEPEGDAFRFFVYGFRLGKSQPRLSVAFYAFDGKNLKSLWEVHDLYDGKVYFDKDRVVIRFLNEQEYIEEAAHGRNPPRHQTVYTITPTGLDIQSEQDVPF